MANRRLSRRPPGWHEPLAGTAAYTVGLLLLTGSVGAAPAIDCSTEAAALTREEAELPRLEVASPADRPPYCITLETIMAFAGRVKAHAARCPRSDHIPTVVEWDNRRTEYSRLFSQYRCKRAR
jgi:hypothetical protein